MQPRLPISGNAVGYRSSDTFPFRRRQRIVNGTRGSDIVTPKRLDQRQDRRPQDLGRDGADVSVGDAAVLAYDEGLRHAVDAPIAGDAPVAVVTGPRIWLAQRVDAARGSQPGRAQCRASVGPEASISVV